jgi:hypothetical protein
MKMERWNDGGSGSQQEFGSSRGNQTRDDKKPKRGKTRPQTNLVTCGHAHAFSSFSFSFLVVKLKELKCISISDYN